jgi:protein-disulfide isomerase
MFTPARSAALLLGALLISLPGCKKTAVSAGAGSSAATTGTPAPTAALAARQTRILDTLKFKIPNLASANPVIGELKPSAYPGLEEGTLTVSLPQRPPQSQKFYITADDRAVFLGEPIDASRTLKELKAERDAQFAKLIAGLPVRGNPAAPVTIVEFSDFQCPYCRQAYQGVMEILKRHPDDVKFIYKQFPLSDIHPWARSAAIISSCAGRQNPAAFWKLHDAYFDAAPGTITPQNLMRISRAALSGVKFDDAKWTACISDPLSPEHQAVEAALGNSLKEGEPLGVQGTPTFFLNGERINLGSPEMNDRLIEAAKRGKD